MIEVHLIGYTADLKHLVLDVDANEERGRYRLVVDGDLFATLDDVRQQRWEQGLDVGVWEPDGEYEYEDAEYADEAEVDESAEEVEGVEDPATYDDAYDLDSQYEDWADDDHEDDEDDLLVDLAEAEAGDDVAEADEPAEEPGTGIRSLVEDEPDDELFGDQALDALIGRASADSADEPAVRIVPAPEPEPVPDEPAAVADEPEPAVEPEPVAEADPVQEEPVAEWEDLSEDWLDEEPVDEPAPAFEEPAFEEPAFEEPAFEEPAFEEPAFEEPEVDQPEADQPEAPAPAAPARARDTDIPTALPSALARRVTKEGLEIPANAKLTPAEIQAELRKGRSVKAVAKDAGTDQAWVRRWLEPIQAEQARVVEQARRLAVARNGQPSALPLEEAVELRLLRRNVDPTSTSWDAVRRADGTWRISCRFEEKGRNRTASWVWTRGEERLRPASELAREIGWVDRRLARQR